MRRIPWPPRARTSGIRLRDLRKLTALPNGRSASLLFKQSRAAVIVAGDRAEQAALKGASKNPVDWIGLIVALPARR
jgi:hypothetical protein